MNDNNEIEMVWVEFVGGPLNGQCRNLPRAQTRFDAAYSLSKNVFEMEWAHATYKIERVCFGKPGTVGFREAFKGVLI